MRSFIVQSSAYNQLPNTSILSITKRKIQVTAKVLSLLYSRPIHKTNEKNAATGKERLFGF